MNSKMQNQKSLEQQVQIASSDLESSKNEELEAVAGGLDALGKTFSLRGKVVRWAAVAASVAGISVGIGMPAQAINRVACNEQGYLRIAQQQDIIDTMCFANAGGAKVLIADVHSLSSGNNAGFVVTNKGRFNFGKNQRFNFIKTVGTVTITELVIYGRL